MIINDSFRYTKTTTILLVLMLFVSVIVTISYAKISKHNPTISVTHISSKLVKEHKDFLLRDNNMFLGNKDGQNKIAIFTDFRCGACVRELDTILSSDNHNTKYLIKPVIVTHNKEYGLKVAQTAIEAAKKGQFKEFAKKLSNHTQHFYNFPTDEAKKLIDQDNNILADTHAFGVPVAVSL